MIGFLLMQNIKMPANRSDRVLRVHIQTKPSIYKCISAKHIPNQLDPIKTRNNYSKKTETEYTTKRQENAVTKAN